MKKISLLLFATLFCAAGLFAEKAPTIATVDVQRVLNDYNAFQAAVEKIKSAVAPVEEEMRTMQENMQIIINRGRELEAEIENPSVAEERKTEARVEIDGLRAQLQEGQLEIQQFRQQAQQLAQQGQQEDLAPLQQKAMEVVKEVAEDKGIDVVLPLNTLVFASDELEITDSVIAVLNANE